MGKSKVNKTNIERKEDKAMENKDVFVNEKAFETVSKKGTPMIVLIDKDGNYHYIDLTRKTKYHVYTGEPYESKEHNAYTIIKDEQKPNTTEAF